MTIYKIQFQNSVHEFKSLQDAQTFAQQNNLDLALIQSEERIVPVDYFSLVYSSISSKQSQSLKILTDIFTQNTLEQISVQQSKELFLKHHIIILCIMVGAFPTAYSLLEEVEPEGFVTQERLENWKSILAQYL